MIESPCIDVCTIDPESGLCIGCSRTQEEINNWSIINDKQQRAIINKNKNRTTKT